MNDDLHTPFECATSSDDGETTIAVAGEIDLATAPEVSEALNRAIREGSQLVLLDLSEATFLDSSGLRVILSANSEASRAEVTFEVVPGPPSVQRSFEVAGVAGHLNFRDS